MSRSAALVCVCSLLAVAPAYGGAPVLSPVDGTPSNGRTAVILIHGFFSSDPWGDFVATVNVNPQLNQRIKLFKFHYDTNPLNIGSSDPQTVADVGTALGDAIRQAFQDGTFDGGQVILIAHSMGGLVARSMMKYYTFGTTKGSSIVSLLITLGTPHHGTPLANDGRFLPVLFDAVGVIAGSFVDDMRWDGYNADEIYCNPTLRKLNSFSDNGQFLFFPGLYCPTTANPPPDIEDGKLVAYGGVTTSPTSGWLQFGQFLLGNSGLFGNDGAVPLESAIFSSWSVQHTYLANPCDHFQLPGMACMVTRAGQQIFLFESVKQDILAVLPVPVIGEVSPSQLPAGSAAQLLTILGSGFTAASQLQFFDGTNTYAGRVPTFVSPTQLTYAIHVGTTAGNWTVVVDNGTQASNAFPFVVTASTAASAPASPIGLTATPAGWSRVTLFYADWTNPPDPSGIARVWWQTDSPPRFPSDGVPFALPLFKPLPLGFLGDGIKTFYVWLENGAGLADFTTARAVTVMRDLTPPVIQITSPTSGPQLTWSGAILPLAGTCSDNLSGVQSVVWRNDSGGGGAASLSGGTWSASIPLAPGDNSLTVTAVDAAGNSAAGTLTVTRPPTLGSIQVTILPSAAVTAGAQWKLNSDTSWHPSGTADASLPLGTYQVIYQPIPGWVAPAAQSVAISQASPNVAISSAPYVQTLLSASPADLSYFQQGTQAPAPQTLQITDRTGGSIHWTATTDQSWLQLSASSGAGSTQLSVSVNTANLGLGLHLANITVSDQAGIQPSQIVGVVLTVLSSGKIDFSWTRRADLPQGRIDASIAVLADGIHLIGGNSLLAHDLFNPSTNSWTPRAQPPAYLGEGGAVVIGQKIYAEDETLAPIMIYDDLSDNWTTGTSPSMAHRGPAVASVGGSMLLISGVDANVNATATVESYDPATNRWALRAPIPTPRAWSACAVLNGLVYVIGGRSLSNSGPDILNTLEIYDPALDKWTTGTPMPTRRSSVAAAVLGGRIYVFGGFDGANFIATVEEYNPVTAGWRTLPPLTSPRYGLAATSVGNSVYLFGGSYTALVERGDPFGLPNRPPVAVPDAVWTLLSQPLREIDVLTNDYDPDGDAIRIASVLSPQHGTAAADPTNTFISYTPAPGFTGTDLFQYTITDGFGGVGETTVTVQVRPQLTNLRVTLVPAAVVALGASWRLSTDATWHASGDILYGLSPGDYTVQCSSVAGWKTPALQTLHLDGTVAEVDLTLGPYQGTQFFTVVPCRLLDTRIPAQGPALTAGVLRTVQTAGSCGIPSSAVAISVNATVVGPGAPGYLSLFPAGTPLPPTSSLNFRAGQVRANNLVLGVSGDGTASIAIYPALAQNAKTDVLVDVNGYFE
jgi:Big-like domain-containing protein/PGAP1-like protein/Kelch motif protein/glucodextranase-like protein/BACON domain-containing protein